MSGGPPSRPAERAHRPRPWRCCRRGRRRRPDRRRARRTRSACGSAVSRVHDVLQGARLGLGGVHQLGQRGQGLVALPLGRRELHDVSRSRPCAGPTRDPCEPPIQPSVVPAGQSLRLIARSGASTNRPSDRRSRPPARASRLGGGEDEGARRCTRGRPAAWRAAGGPTSPRATGSGAGAVVDQVGPLLGRAEHAEVESQAPPTPGPSAGRGPTTPGCGGAPGQLAVVGGASDGVTQHVPCRVEVGMRTGIAPGVGMVVPGGAPVGGPHLVGGRGHRDAEHVVVRPLPHPRHRSVRERQGEDGGGRAGHRRLGGRLDRPFDEGQRHRAAARSRERPT